MVCGLNPDYLEITMTIMLIAVALYTILGGMLSVLVTDFLQFIVMSCGMIGVTLLILFKIGWSGLTTAVQSEHGQGGFNPFLHEEMGWEYVVFNSMVALAMMLTWQTTIQRLLAAKDTKTGQRIYIGTSFFFVCRFLLPGIWGIAALAVLVPGQIPTGNSLHGMPVFLSLYVPVGLMGILIAAMLAADMSTNSAYMLTWGSVIYNDLLAPIHKGRWTEKRGIFWNRIIVGSIGIFLLIYGLWYPLKEDLWTYLAVTGTIYLSSMSVLLIACCYWKKANSWGAGAAIVTGAVIPLTFLVMQQVESTVWITEKIGPYYSGMATYLAVGLAMIIGSLVKRAVRPGEVA